MSVRKPNICRKRSGWQGGGEGGGLGGVGGGGGCNLYLHILLNPTDVVPLYTVSS